MQCSIPTSQMWCTHVTSHCIILCEVAAIQGLDCEWHHSQQQAQVSWVASLIVRPQVDCAVSLFCNIQQTTYCICVFFSFRSHHQTHNDSVCSQSRGTLCTVAIINLLQILFVCFVCAMTNTCQTRQQVQVTCKKGQNMKIYPITVTAWTCTGTTCFTSTCFN